MFVARKRRTLCRGGAAAVTASAALVLGGCGDTAGPEAGTDVEDIQNDPDAGVLGDFSQARSFAGQRVTVSAEVDQIVGPKAFTMADDAGEELLVVHRALAPNVAVNTPVRVTGTVKKAFDIRAAEEFSRADFNDEAFGAFSAEPYIQASNIDTTVTPNQGGGNQGGGQ